MSQPQTNIHKLRLKWYEAKRVCCDAKMLEKKKKKKKKKKYSQVGGAKYHKFGLNRPV